jgi:hypothetical protein
MNKDFHIGDFVVEKSAINSSSTELILYKIIDIELVDQNSSFWIKGINDEEYYLYQVEVVKVFPCRLIRKRRRTWFLNEEIIHIDEYMMKNN